MGHVRNYALGDVVARFKRAKGLMFSIRWGGMLLVFQRKTAIERGVHPSKWTIENIAAMRP